MGSVNPLHKATAALLSQLCLEKFNANLIIRIFVRRCIAVVVICIYCLGNEALPSLSPSSL